MKEPAHQRTEEEIKFVFDSLGWNYSPLCGGQRAYDTCSCTRFQSFNKPLDPQPLAQCLYIWGQYINREKNTVTK